MANNDHKYNHSSGNTHHGRNTSSRRKKRVPNYPRIIGVVIPILLLICVIAVIIRIQLWNRGVEYVMTEEDYNNIKLDTKDNIILMPPSVLSKDNYDGETKILIFGNDSYLEGSSNGTDIIHLFEKEISDDVEIINCCLPGSMLNSYYTNALSPSECPEDYFTLFWLTFSLSRKDFSQQREALKYLNTSYDTERYKEVISVMENLDMKDIDIVMYCYDGHDYLRGNMPVDYNDDGVSPLTEDPFTLLGALYTSIYLFNTSNPDTQFVYVSPAFCYGFDENGKKISCAILDTGYGTIEATFNAARLTTTYYGFSYVDLYSGVAINEDNGEKYLEDDGITPNKKAREMIADRLVTLLKERLVQSNKD